MIVSGAVASCTTSPTEQVRQVEVAQLAMRRNTDFLGSASNRGRDFVVRLLEGDTNFMKSSSAGCGFAQSSELIHFFPVPSASTPRAATEWPSLQWL